MPPTHNVKRRYVEPPPEERPLEHISMTLDEPGEYAYVKFDTEQGTYKYEVYVGDGDVEEDMLPLSDSQFEALTDMFAEARREYDRRKAA